MLLYTVRKSQNIEGLIINPFTAEPTVTAHADTFGCSSDLQKHEPSGFCFYIKGIDPNISFKPIIYTKTNDSDNVASIFVNKLAEVTNSIYNDFYRHPKN